MLLEDDEINQLEHHGMDQDQIVMEYEQDEMNKNVDHKNSECLQI